MTFGGTWFGDLTTQGHRQVSTSTPTDEQPLRESERDVQACMFGESLFPRSQLDPYHYQGTESATCHEFGCACSRFATLGIVIRSSRLRARKGSATATVELCKRFLTKVWMTRPGRADEDVGRTARSLHLSACAAESG
jgi:hypothetical protein